MDTIRWLIPFELCFEDLGHHAWISGGIKELLLTTLIVVCSFAEILLMIYIYIYTYIHVICIPYMYIYIHNIYSIYIYIIYFFNILKLTPVCSSLRTEVHIQSLRLRPISAWEPQKKKGAMALLSRSRFCFAQAKPFKHAFYIWSQKNDHESRY